MVPHDLWEKKLLHEQESKLWFLSSGRPLQCVNFINPRHACAKGLQ